jgi:hypothetical protein
MFSELRHHARFQLQLKNNDAVPSHVNQDWPGKSNYQREAIILEKLFVLFCFCFLNYFNIFVEKHQIQILLYHQKVLTMSMLRVSIDIDFHADQLYHLYTQFHRMLF